MRRATWWVAAVVVAMIASACVPEWTTYHRDNTRQGADPTATDITPAAIAWRSNPLDALVYAAPLVYNNRVYVATEGNTIVALDLATGGVVWSKHLAAPLDQAAAGVPTGCRLNIAIVGITGTPVIDPSTNTIYAVLQTGPTPGHALVGLDTETGAGKVLASADPPGADTASQFNRPALALGNGRVYIAYGKADCNTFYQGKLVSLRTDGTAPLVYTVPSRFRGSLWATSGPAIDGDGSVWIGTGNGAAPMPGALPDHTTSVIKLSPTLQELGYFTPSNWAALNTAGRELGSAGPLLLPNDLVFAAGKNGTAYLFRQSSPPGVGGELASAPLPRQPGSSGTCLSWGGHAYNQGVVYVPCHDGMLAFAVDPGPGLRFLWKGPPGTLGSPSFGGNTVWNIDYDAGLLYALNPADGKTKQSPINVGHARHFTTPTIVGDTVIVATDTTIVALRKQS
jgi:polyvinyl alcohol dehydrogenase (cytochrome)